ncbi:methyl-accepting chemotaxis protein [bacterium]|nr:methyl-accepting chemotaxis protein [bacterium]
MKSENINLSITFKILLFLAVLIGSLGVTQYLTSRKSSIDLLSQIFMEKGKTIASSIGKNCSFFIIVGDHSQVLNIIKSFKAEYDLTFVHIFNSEGELIISTEPNDVPDAPSSLQSLTKIDIHISKFADNKEFLDIALPLYDDLFTGSGAAESDDLSTGFEMDLNFDENALTQGPGTSHQIMEKNKIGVIQLQMPISMTSRFEKIKRGLIYNNILIFLIVFVIALLGLNRIIKPFNEIVQVLHYITYKNDLTVSVKIPKQKEMSIMAQAFNSLIETLTYQIQNTKDAALKIVNAIQAILAASDEQETASREQVSAVTQTIASMTELSQSSRLIDQNSHKVASYADSTLKSAQEGVEAVSKVVDAISRIEQSSLSINASINELAEKIKQIQQIINIIEEFTEQTKLIAFNAAIEAASAKEVSRRFAVVANEVRKLAGDIEKSSRDITHVIVEILDTSDATLKISQDGQEQVKTGVEISAGAKESITRIFKSVAETTNITKQISIYTSQQIASNDEVVKAMKEILSLAERSKQNSAETNKAAENLSELSETLTEMVEKFKIQA